VGLANAETAILLKALTAAGLLEADNGSYRLRRAYRPFLLSGPVSAVADLSRYRAENEVWLEMADILRGRKEAPEDYSRELLEGKAAGFPALRRFNALYASDVADILRRRIGTPAAILDIGGGDGVLAGQLLETFESAAVAILELGGGAEPAREALGGEMAAGRLRIVTGDARDFTPDGEYDLVILNELLELFNAEDKVRIVRNAKLATAPGGHLAFVKFGLDETGHHPPSSAIFSMRMLLKSGGYLETDAELAAFLETEGLLDIETASVGPMKTLVLARR
jgi:SAM-dependent methyltransferase